MITTSFHGKKIICLWHILGYLKNHWTQHRLVCAHIDAFYILLPNIGIILNNSGIFENLLNNEVSTALESLDRKIGQFLLSFWYHTKSENFQLFYLTPKLRLTSKIVMSNNLKTATCLLMCAPLTL